MDKPSLRIFFRGKMHYNVTSQNIASLFRSDPTITEQEFVTDCKIMASFRKRDCNGRIIYTGDIIKVIKREHALFRARFIVHWDKHIHKYEPFDILLEAQQNCAVIGNVYEHPERTKGIVHIVLPDLG